MDLLYSVTITVSSYVRVPYYSQRTLLPCSHPPPPELPSLYPFFVSMPESWAERLWYRCPIEVRAFQCPCSVNLNQLLVSMLIAIYCKEKLNCWVLRDGLGAMSLAVTVILCCWLYLSRSCPWICLATLVIIAALKVLIWVEWWFPFLPDSMHSIFQHWER